MQASYYAMIEQLDHEFGRILDYLDAEGLREDTIVIFTSDHGEALGDHGLVYKGCRFYEGIGSGAAHGFVANTLLAGRSKRCAC